MHIHTNLLLMLLLLLPSSLEAVTYPHTFTDSTNRAITLNSRPERVVSLVPSVTEILLRVGAGEAVAGITYHSVLPPESSDQEIIGGFFNPDLERVAELQPDVIFYSGLHEEMIARFRNKATLIQLSPQSIEDVFAHIRLLAKIFSREEAAESIIAEQERQLLLIKKKVAKIPPAKRVRVMRLMGRDRVKSPGDDSFQNEFIRAAGGISPTLGQNGNIVPVELEQWQDFNPQVLYGCGDDRKVRSILDQPGWREVDAVKNRRIFFFPCDLTCRASTHTGTFVSWLSARMYTKEFGDAAAFVLPQQVVERKPLDIDLDYLSKAEILTSDIKDFRNKTLALSFAAPMKVVSTLEGERTGISTVANHYFPPPSWGLGDQHGLKSLRDATLKVLDLPVDTTSMLFTGADMDNLAVVKKEFKAMQVIALVTAGVKGNAVRMSQDSGAFYEPGEKDQSQPGTINIILLTNMELSPRAMTRAIISATEAKTAALQDMDIRSSYSPAINQSTGTGTDNLLVVQGTGQRIDASGGHTKMGELIAKATYQGVREAVHQQNGLVTKRSVFQRLKERQIDLHVLCRQWLGKDEANRLHKEMESLLLQPKYADFIKAALSLSDAHGKGLLADTESFRLWSQAIASEIAGKEVDVTGHRFPELPPIIASALDAMISGAVSQIELGQ